MAKENVGSVECMLIPTRREELEDLNKRIRIIKNMEDIVRTQFGKVSVSYDTELCVMCDYCDYLIEELEKQKKPIVAELKADITARKEELEQELNHLVEEV